MMLQHVVVIVVVVAAAAKGCPSALRFLLSPLENVAHLHTCLVHMQAMLSLSIDV